MPRMTRWRWWHAPLVLLALDLIVFGDLLLSGGTRLPSDFRGDLGGQFLGWRAFGFGELAHGRLPLWNPHLFCGAPFLAGFQSALLYPPNWIYCVLPLGWAVNVDVALHVWLGGLFTCAWAARRKLDPLACLLAGTVFMFGGPHYLHVSQGHLPNLCTMIWVPLLLLAVDALIDGDARPARWVLLGSAAAAMELLAGHVQYVYYTALALPIYAALCLATRPRGTRARAVGLLAITALLAAGLSAIQWLPGVAAGQEGVRGSTPLEVARSFWLPPENLLTLVMPGLFGHATPAAPYWGKWYLAETTLFVGVPALALAVFAAVCGQRQHRRFAVPMIGLSLLVALGASTPLYDVLAHVVPGFGTFRGVSKFAFVALPFLAMLAAVGLDVLLRPGPQAPGRRWPPRILLAAGALLIAFGLVMLPSTHGGRAPSAWASLLSSVHWSAFGYMPDPSRPTGEALYALAARTVGRSTLLCGVTAALTAALWWAATREGPHRIRWAMCLAALSAIELLVFARAFRPTFEMAEAQRHVADYRAATASLQPDERVLAPNQSTVLLAGGLDVWGDDPMVLARYARFVASQQGLTVQDLFLGQAYRHVTPAWSLLRLRLLLQGKQGHLEPRTLDGPLPRALLVPKWEVLRDETAVLARLTGRQPFDPRAEVMLESEPRFPAAPPAPQLAPSVAVGDPSTDAVEIEAQTPVPAVLLITDSYAPEWRANALEGSDQAQYDVLPADGTLRAIPLAPGRHHLRLEYRPAAFTAGKWITVATLLAWFAVLLQSRRRPA